MRDFVILFNIYTLIVKSFFKNNYSIKLNKFLTIKAKYKVVVSLQ